MKIERVNEQLNSKNVPKSLKLHKKMSCIWYKNSIKITTYNFIRN